MVRTAFLAASLLACAAAAGAQPPAGQAPPPLTNLQVIPKDTPRPQVIQTMRAFALGLGVRCEHCHVEGNFASDELRTKAVAREMMKLTADLNTKLPGAVQKTAADATRIQCVTCHRGVAIPKQLADILSATSAGSGLDAAIKQYRDLRAQYYGNQSYDFTDGSGATLAERAMAANKPAEAVRWATLNLEYFPASQRSLLLMGQAQAAAGNPAAAIAAYEKLLALDPGNALAKRMLDQLKR